MKVFFIKYLYIFLLFILTMKYITTIKTSINNEKEVNFIEIIL